MPKEINKAGILFILHLPPPVHGAAMMGQYIKDSPLINRCFDADYINLSTSSSLKSIGKLGLGKLLAIVKIQLRVIKALLTKRYALTYISLNTKGAGFYKDMITVLIVKLFRKKLVYHFHNKGVAVHQHKWFYHLFYRLAFYKTKSILLSPYLYRDVARYVKKKDVFFCPNGIVRTKHTEDSCVRTNKLGQPCRLLFLSNMLVEKGIIVLLEACSILQKAGFLFQCHFVGDWLTISEAQFRNVVKSLALEQQVYIHGKKLGEEKNQFFSQADIFVFPSYYDCFPLVLLEAMEWSLPIVSSFEGGIPDMVKNNETGFLVDKKDPIALADKLAILMNDPELRQEMGRKGKERYNSLFTYEQFEVSIKHILEKVINKENGNPAVPEQSKKVNHKKRLTW